MTGTKVEAIHHHGVPVDRGLRRRARARAPSRTRTPTVCRSAPSTSATTTAPATIVCGAPNVAAGQTVAVARPGAVMPDGTQARSRRSCAACVSDGMILPRASCEIGAGRRRRGILVLDGRCSTPSSRRARRSRTCCRSRCDVLELEITPNRPGLPRRLRRGARAARRHRRAAGAAPWSEDPGSPGAARGRRR